ncbi:helix-turn-helix domain-containing protein [Acidovorax sp. Be4]|uniref:Helix-turn-helix domain-containing protein n=1 Tax=Acidovorax bellezanensis TaxID=2976702 RepID=A0ABT2PPP1_9BURK|nr:helix-turn-helix domain-containing protein [Acidovorax sp. Be4]MCT9812440.1 helix-turn-helix domain-containing protein [Acidovorax sp. Be4]
MSVDYMTLAWRTELQAGPRLVLLAVCDNANDEGNCFPSVQSLADKCGLSVRAVRGHLSAMDAQGLLGRNERMGRSSEYQIDLKALRAAVFKCLSARKYLTEYDKGILRSCAPDPEEKQTPADSAPRQILPPTPADSAGHPGNNCIPPRQILQAPSADSAAITINEPSLNQQVKKDKRVAAPAFALPDWIDQQHWDAWHSCDKRKKATNEQKQMAVNKLAKWRDEGVDHAAALENAAIAGWQGLFRPDVPASAMTPGRRTPAPENFAARTYVGGKL